MDNERILTEGEVTHIRQKCGVYELKQAGRQTIAEILDRQDAKTRAATLREVRLIVANEEHIRDVGNDITGHNVCVRLLNEIDLLLRA